jgi:hypothetical protein
MGVPIRGDGFAFARRDCRRSGNGQAATLSDLIFRAEVARG